MYGQQPELLLAETKLFRFKVTGYQPSGLRLRSLPLRAGEVSIDKDREFSQSLSNLKPTGNGNERTAT